MCPRSVLDGITTGQLTTSEVENYGDILYPIVLRRLMERRGFGGAIPTFGLLAGEAPGRGGYRIESFTELACSPRRRLDALVIGGGDLIRTDVPMLSWHYAAMDAVTRRGL